MQESSEVCCVLDEARAGSTDSMEDFSLEDDLAKVSLRHLEVFSAVVREASYANAGLDLQITGTKVKRVCEEFSGIMGRELLGGAQDPVPTPFGQEVFAQMGPLSRSLLAMEDGVKRLHQAGRVLRFGADGGFFRGGLFTNYLGRLDFSGKFRSCFLKVEAKNAQKSLLAAECDVYFGIGLGVAERLDRIELGEVDWHINRVGGGKLPKKTKDLKGNWYVVEEGDPGVCEEILGEFRKAGAEGGKLISREAAGKLEKGAVCFSADVISPLGKGSGVWPGFQFSALMRRHHPYADLKGLLCAGVGKECLNGH